MRTTIDLPDELFREAKAQAAKEGISLKDFFTSAVRNKVAQLSSRKPHRVKLPLIPPHRVKSVKFLTNADIEAILDNENYPHRR